MTFLRRWTRTNYVDFIHVTWLPRYFDALQESHAVSPLSPDRRQLAEHREYRTSQLPVAIMNEFKICKSYLGPNIGHNSDKRQSMDDRMVRH